LAIWIIAIGSMTQSVSWGQNQESSEFKQIVERFGGPSRVWLIESGETGFANWDERRITEDFGVIAQWDNEQLVLLRPDATVPSRIIGDQVICIDPEWSSAECRQIHTQYKKQEFRQILKEGLGVLKGAKVPNWQRAVLVSELVGAALAEKRYRIAGTVFVPLAKDRVPQLLLSMVPIPWSNELVSAGPEVLAEAEKWMADDAPMVQLMGASWLLGGSRRSDAIEVLERLEKNGSGLVSDYAKCQLWRTVPPATILSEHYPKWVAHRDSIHLPAQAGPTMLLADRLQQAGELELAIPCWLRIASLHTDRYDLRRAAIDNAVSALKSLGRGDEADRLEKMR
jgi:hypothetical protein